jgi:hypothetical protein
MAAQTHDAWAETRKIQKEFSGFYKIAGGLVLVFIGIMIGASLFHNDEGYWGNILSEVLGIGFAVFVLDQRAEQRRVKDLQERLVMEAGSRSNETAKRAVDELRYRGWLEGDNSLLGGANLVGANLQKANFWAANLQEAKLGTANLQGATLGAANLQKAGLWDANLQGANLLAVNLQGANLVGANLQGAILVHANLQRANLAQTNLQGTDLARAKLQEATLTKANLQGANLWFAEFNENTALPDGRKWTTDTDMARFTDPQHPNFWRSYDKYSPAYRGKSDGG